MSTSTLRWGAAARASAALCAAMLDAWTVSLFGNNLSDAEYHDMGSAAGGFQFHGGLAR